MQLSSSEVARLKAALSDRPPGEFHFPEIYGSGWEELWIGDKVKTGRAFLNAVRSGVFPGVEDTGRKAGGGRLYRWRG
ncbi:DUF1413 domain-containing protein [Amorphus orientalis]|uniref:DUF1413 domain-containing protein n=1 Tax=Amorphus orientalis TaxID=649198 RepID=A0AAE3VLD0_9HYPH|nr:DUF1413 domain-containing protein [Amorphus orientalis]MDQ0314150.1 hypothetical protein [Amorphus orientalis]